MKVLFFNVGETEVSTSPIATHFMGEIDNKEMRDAIAARDMGYGGPISTTGEIQFKNGEVFYKKQFLCYAKDFFVRHLTQNGRQQVLQSAIHACEVLRHEDIDNIFMYMPTQMDHDEVASVVYNICFENGQLLNEDNIIHDDRIAEYADFKAKSAIAGRSDAEIKKDYRKGVLSFLQDITSKTSGRKFTDVVVIVGGNDIYQMLTTDKKAERYCMLDERDIGRKLEPGEVVPMYIEQPKSTIERIFS